MDGRAGRHTCCGMGWDGTVPRSVMEEGEEKAGLGSWVELEARQPPVRDALCRSLTADRGGANAATDSCSAEAEAGW